MCLLNCPKASCKIGNNKERKKETQRQKNAPFVVYIKVKSKAMPVAGCGGL
jgi:hypothetical protein